MKSSTATTNRKVRAAKAPAGPSGYNAGFCDLVRRLARAGVSKEEMPARLCVHPQTLDKWAAAHPEFAEAMSGALDSAQAWWESLGQCSLLMGEDFDCEAYITQMTGRFPGDYQR
jgi:hypothetical protein